MAQQQKQFDVKTILTFVILIGLVLMLPRILEGLGIVDPAPKHPSQPESSITQSPAGQPSDNPSATASPERTASAATETDAGSPSATGFVSDSNWSEEYVRVETEYYEALVSTRGAQLRRLVLKTHKYTDPARRKESIVMLDTTDVAGPRFRFPRDVFDWSNAPFRASRTSVNLQGADSTEIRFTARTRAGNDLVVTYIFHGDRYDFDIALTLPRPWEEKVEREYFFGWEGGLWPTEPNPEDDNNHFTAAALMGEDLEKINDVESESPRTSTNGLTHWAAVRTKYFVCAVIPRDREADGFVVEARERPFRYEGKLISLKQFSALLRVPISAGTPLNERFTVYAGPIDYSELKDYGVGLEDLVDLGWRWLVRPFALMILWLFKAIHGVVPNYGLVIILFSLGIKVIFHPLTKKSMRSMRQMQLLQPRIAKLKERFKDDSARLNQETMKLYKESGINPISGCLPLLPQMPIFYGLFQVFRTTIELRGAYFFGWLTDLSQKDPYYILPIVMTVSFFLQQRLSSKDPKQKSLTYILPLVFGFMFKDFPAGLTLYWTMYNIFSVVEQTWLIGHPSPTDTPDEEVGSGAIVKTTPKKRRR